jgi:hypothetical protein
LATLLAGSVGVGEVEDGTGGQTQTIELDENTLAGQAEVIGRAVDAIGLAALALVIVSDGLTTRIHSSGTGAGASVAEKQIVGAALRANG